MVRETLFLMTREACRVSGISRLPVNDAVSDRGIDLLISVEWAVFYRKHSETRKHCDSQRTDSARSNHSDSCSKAALSACIKENDGDECQTNESSLASVRTPPRYGFTTGRVSSTAVACGFICRYKSLILSLVARISRNSFSSFFCSSSRCNCLST